MPLIAAWEVETPAGDADATVAALCAERGGPQLLFGPLRERVVALAQRACGAEPPDLALVATTKGDLPLWCHDLFAVPSTGLGGPAWLAGEVGEALGCPAVAVCAACASGPAALAEAARRVAAGRARRVLVLGADRIGPFVSDGFAALGAIDATRCRPFDRDRDGLALGETVAALLVTAGDGDGPRVQGWGGSMDANHLTGPARDGAGLAAACRAALARAGREAPGWVCAHGTGTRYNDDSEMAAYAALCPAAPITAWKGLLGHSLGASGLTEAALAAHVLGGRAPLPGIAHLQAPERDDLRLLPPGAHDAPRGPALSANAGFGGLNAAVVLGTEPPRPLAERDARLARRVELDSAGWRLSGDRGESGAWRTPGAGGALPALGAREVLGRVDASWGRMDLACRALVACCRLLAPIDEAAALVLLTERGSAATDRRYEERRRDGGADPQLFPYTLPSTAVGEAGIRTPLRGPGCALLGAGDAFGRETAELLLRDGAPAAVLARVECDAPPHLAWAELWVPS